MIIRVSATRLHSYHIRIRILWCCKNLDVRSEPMLRLSRYPLVVSSCSYSFLACLIFNCPWFTYARTCIHEQSVLSGFNCDPVTKPRSPCFPPDLPRVRYRLPCALLARIESFVSHMNVHARPYVIYLHTAAISAFLSSVVAQSRAWRIYVHIYLYIYIDVCVRGVCVFDYARQPRITCHKLVLPGIASADTETGVHTAFRGKCLEVLAAYLMQLHGSKF